MRILTTVAVLGLLVGTPALGAEGWQREIASGLGKQGTEMPGGVYRVGLPRTDLNVTLDEVAIKPALALGLDVFEPDARTFRRIAHLPTAAGARTALFVPELDRLFLAVRARDRKPAAIWVYQPDP